MAGEAQLEQFVLLAKGTRGRAIADLVLKATSTPGLFVFGELLDLPSVKELKGTEQASVFALLELFAYGSLPDYRSALAALLALDSAGSGLCWLRRLQNRVLSLYCVVGGAQQFGELTELQLNKLKQLTIVSLAADTKMIAYADIMQQLIISNIRELEDFIIGECFYAGIIKGKLDQRKQCLHVHDAISRDIPREQIASILQGLRSWHEQTTGVMAAIEDRKAWAQQETVSAERQQAQLEARLEEIRKGWKGETAAELGALDPEPLVADLMEHERSTGARPKRRR